MNGMNKNSFVSLLLVNYATKFCNSCEAEITILNGIWHVGLLIRIDKSHYGFSFRKDRFAMTTLNVWKYFWKSSPCLYGYKMAFLLLPKITVLKSLTFGFWFDQTHWCQGKSGKQTFYEIILLKGLIRNCIYGNVLCNTLQNLIVSALFVFIRLSRVSLNECNGFLFC